MTPKQLFLCVKFYFTLHFSNKKKLLFFPFLFMLALLTCEITSCSTPTTVSFLNNDRDVQIYVNGDYVGTGLVRYTFPKEVTTADIECKKDGSVIFTRSYNIKDLNNQLLDLNIPNNLFYSTERKN